MTTTAATGRRRRPRDGCVVEAAPLSRLLKSFIAGWPSEANGGRFAAGGDDRRTELRFVSPVAWLSSASGLPVATIDNIASRRYQSTELWVADALLCALGRPELLHTELTVMPNPSATRQARAACCGGSTG